MMRHTLLKELNGYAEWADLAEDYELWTRAAQKSRLVNLPYTLFKLRRHEGSVTVLRRTDQVQVCGKAAAYFHRSLLGR